MTAGLFAFILRLYRCHSSFAMARPLDFAVSHKKGRPLPLLVDRPTGMRFGYREPGKMAPWRYLQRGITNDLASNT